MVQRSLMKAGSGIFAAMIAAGSVFPTALANPLAPDIERHVIADPQSGLALFGFDPITYHVEQRARPGLQDYELRHENLIWRFRSAANREAFRADPSAYIPAFGGNDGFGISQGVMTAGDPEMFALTARGVVLFRSMENRDRYTADADLRRKAVADWPEVVRQHAAH